jgi:coproporphyrinogen III oxidase-like Fe-S oxidoreductase
MFLGLREREGVDPAAFAQRFGRPLEDVHPEVAVFRADGFLEDRNRRLALSERGLLLADSIFAAFL